MIKKKLKNSKRKALFEPKLKFLNGHFQITKFIHDCLCAMCINMLMVSVRAKF